MFLPVVSIYLRVAPFMTENFFRLGPVGHQFGKMVQQDGEHLFLVNFDILGPELTGGVEHHTHTALGDCNAMILRENLKVIKLKKLHRYLTDYSI